MEQAWRVTLTLYAGALCCFGGYRLRRPLVALAGVLTGAAAGFVLARLLKLALFWWGIGLAAGLAIALGILAYRMHKLGLFLVCGACAMGTVYPLLQSIGVPEPWMVYAASVAVGIAVGLLVYRFYRPAVIVTTAAFGGMLLASTVFALLAQTLQVQLFGQGVGLATAIVGAVLQFRGPR